MNLREFETLKSPLLKEWNESQFERIKKHINFILKTNFNDFAIIERGADYKTIQYKRAEDLGDLFGLPYTSSSSFAAVWNTNTQTRTRYGAPLYFVGVAINEDLKPVIIFEDKNEKPFYFVDYDFITYQKHEKRKERAKEWGEFIKKCNKIKNNTLQILKKYEGKPYGEKTRDKIAEEIQTATGGSVSAWLDSSQYCNGLEISKNKFTKKFYFDFLTEGNKIKEPTTHNGAPVEDLNETDTAQAFANAEKLEKRITQKARELLQLVKDFNTYTTQANTTSKATASTYKFDLENVAGGRFDYEGE